MATKKEKISENIEDVVQEKEDKKFHVIDPLNPANISIPKTFDIEETLIDLVDINGNTEKYMPVRARQAWRLQNNPKAPMPITELIKDDNGIVLYKATLYSDDGNSVVATAHGSAMFKNFPETEINKAYEMAETRAIGRCLTNIGYGISFKEDGNEGYPIDKENTNTPINSLNNIIDSDDDEKNENTAEESKPEAVLDFEKLSNEDKAIAVLETGFPISIKVQGTEMKKVATWKVLSSINKTGESVEYATGKLKWGLDKGLKGIVNEQCNLAFPEYANFLISLLKNADLYKTAIRAIKNKTYSK